MTTTTPYLLEMMDIGKAFPGVQALKNVSFKVRPGTVHALCGENGAGKSTLMKILSGIHQPDEGKIRMSGETVSIGSPAQAQALGIGMIAQELNYFPDLTVEENLFVGRLPGKGWHINWKAHRASAKSILEEHHLMHLYGQKISAFSISEIQQVEIAKALSLDAKLLIMDEPTSSITESEVHQLFDKIRALKDQGISIIYISHKLEEIFKIADEVTILRDGAVVTTQPIDAMDEQKMIRGMVGRSLDTLFPKVEAEVGEVLFEARGLNKAGLFRDISFDVKRGEIVGFAGLVGSGRTEVMEGIFGLDPYDRGEVLMEGAPVQLGSVSKAMACGIGLVTENRKETGIVGMRSIRENASLSSLKRFFYGGRLHKKEERAAVSHYFDKMDVKAPSLESPIQSLSGGNQQKVILAKWMMRDPKLLILDEPTRGIDVGNKHTIYELIGKIVQAGKAVVVVSSELPELLGICDRIYVMNHGEIKGMLRRDEFSQERIMSYATTV